MNDPSPTRILVIDDDPAILTLFRGVFGKSAARSALTSGRADQAGDARESGGTRLQTANSGAEGVELLNRAYRAGRPYTIAFVDLRMPGMDGIETTRRLWDIDPSLLVVTFTASEKALCMTELAALEQSDRLLSLRKPLHPVEIRQVTRFLDQRKRTENAYRERTRELNERIKEQKRMQARLTQAHRLEAIGQLAAGIAHEINTPTQYIGDNTRFLGDAFQEVIRVLDLLERLVKSEESPGAELLKQMREAAGAADLRYLAGEIPRAIDQSLEGVDCVAGIVRAMKEFSHPGSEGTVTVDLSQAIESTLTVCRNEWKYVAELVTDFDPALPPVPCLPAELNQAILNLIVNAAHAIAEKVGETGEKGTITVRTRRNGDTAEIHIEDSGTGIPEHLQPRVFDLFFTTKPVGQGTGQGLTTVWSIIVDRHGGAVECHSEPDVGTKFIVRLPLEPAPAGPSLRSAEPDAGRAVRQREPIPWGGR